MAASRGRLPRALARAVGLALGLALAAPVWADEAPPWRVGVDYAVQRDSNLYRVGDGQPLPAGASRSDTVTVLGVDAEADKRLGRQHLRANVRLAHNRYAANEGLNAVSSLAGLALDWDTMGNLSGRLGITDDRRQHKFSGADGISAADQGRNLVDTRTLLATARLGAATRLGLDVRLEHQEVSYSAAAFDYREFRQDVAALGLGYRREGRFSLSLLARATDGRYPRYRPLGQGRFQADTFRRQDVELAAGWVFTPSNRVQLALGPSSIRYERDDSRDASAWTGRMSWELEPTGGLSLRLEGGHDFGQSSTAFEQAGIDGHLDYSRTTSYLRLNAREALTGKLALQSSAGLTRRQLTNRLGLSSSNAIAGSVSGQDDTLLLSAGLRWTPLRGLQLGCDIGRERRRSDQVLSAGMTSHRLGCSVRLGLS